MDFSIILGRRNYNTNIRKTEKGYKTTLYQYSTLSYVKKGYGGLKNIRVDRNFTIYCHIDTYTNSVEVIEIQDLEKKEKVRKDFENLYLNFNEIKTRSQKMVNFESDRILEIVRNMGRDRYE